MCAVLPEKIKKAPLLRIFYGTFVSCLFKCNFKLLTAINFFYAPKKTSFDARISNRSNYYISKNIFTKNHAIRLILFICARVFDFFLPFRKTNVKKQCKENPSALSVDKVRLNQSMKKKFSIHEKSRGTEQPFIKVLLLYHLVLISADQARHWTTCK